MTEKTSRPAVELPHLVEQYHRALYRYAYRLTGSAADADDLTQQTYLSAHSKLHQLREADRAKSWLFTILRNCYLKGLRAGSSNLGVSLDHVAEPAYHERANLTVDEELLQEALNELNEEFRSPIILYYFEEFSYSEIADHMNVPLGTVMSRLARAKCYLRSKLESRQMKQACTAVTPQ